MIITGWSLPMRRMPAEFHGWERSAESNECSAILELAKELDDLRVKYAKTKGKLKEADLELSKLRGDKRHLDDPS